MYVLRELAHCIILFQVIQLTEDLLKDAQQQQPEAVAPKPRCMLQPCLHCSSSMIQNKPRHVTHTKQMAPDV